MRHVHGTCCSRQQSCVAADTPADTEVSVSVLRDKVGELKLDNDRLSMEVSRLTGELDSASTVASTEARASRRREDLLDREVYHGLHLCSVGL